MLESSIYISLRHAGVEAHLHSTLTSVTRDTCGQFNAMALTGLEIWVGLKE
jgi:hypothetical protein